jgi:hypothetical protein
MLLMVVSAKLLADTENMLQVSEAVGSQCHSVSREQR